MGSIVGLLFAVAILCGPPLAFVGLLIWTRKLRASNAPRARIIATQVLAAIIAISIVAGDAVSLFAASEASADAGQPTEKARVLARAIAELMNNSAFVLLIAIVGYAGLMLWSRFQRKSTSS